LRSAIGPTVASVPFTAGSCVAVWDTWPAPQPERATAAATPHAANMKRFTRNLLLGRLRDRGAAALDSTMHSSRWRLAAVAEGARVLRSYLDRVAAPQEMPRRPALVLHGFVTLSTPALHLRCP
jgi:hypothetical protein